MVSAPEVGRVLRLSERMLRICAADIEVSLSFKMFLKVVSNESVD